MNVRPITDADIDAIAALAAEDEAALFGRAVAHRHGRRARLAHARGSRERLVALRGRRASSSPSRGSSHYDDLGVFVGIVAQGAKGRGLGSADRRDRRSSARGSAAPRASRRSCSSRTPRRRDALRALRLRVRAPLLRDGDRARGRAERAGAAGRIHARELPGRGRAPVLRDARRGVPGSLGAPLDPASSAGGRRSRAPTASIRRSGFSFATATTVAATIRNEPERNGGGYVAALGVARPWRGKGLGRALLLRTFAEFYARGVPRVTLGVDAESPTGATKLYESVGMSIENAARRLREGTDMSFLRAKCPTCKTLTAVAIGPEYECHSCGRTFAAGLVRVPRAWGATSAGG